MPIPILTTAQMRSWEEATWAAGGCESDVVARVGEGLARWIRARVRPGESLVLVAGKGHNGDDVRAMGSVLELEGRGFEMVEFGGTDPDLGRLESVVARRVDWIVDGIFGVGLNRPVEGNWRRAIECLNAAGGRGAAVVSVDVPSGLNADTGEPMGVAVRASVTLAVGAVKAGLLGRLAAFWVGRLELLDEVGLTGICPAGTLGSRWVTAGDFEGLPRSRRAWDHKGVFGHVGIVAGSEGYHGAAVLAARGAQRAWPGLVTVCAQEEVYGAVAGGLFSSMVRAWGGVGELPPGLTALVVGPGLASRVLPAVLKEQVAVWWRSWPGALVVDASALDWVPTGVVGGAWPRVITPHPGEAARMLAVDSMVVQSDRASAARALSERFGRCWVVLKGAQTLVGRVGEDQWINGTGNPGLAQGGSGDVLAGLLGGLLAQGWALEQVQRSLAFAVWWHGSVADRLEREGGHWSMEEFVEALRYPPGGRG